MSKSLSLFVPAFGGAALVLGAAYGIATNSYANNKIASMEANVARIQTQADEVAEAATADLTRAADLEAKALKLQNDARAALAQASGGGDLTAPAPLSKGYGLGRVAMAEEIAAWDVDILPDGRGLPKGSGNALDGEEIFAEKCGACHGDFGEGVDNWPVLAGGFDTLADEDPVKTVGSYWPHLSTAYDYIYRSMPFGQAGTLTPDETYAIVAYILYSNDEVDDDFELSHENFAEVAMYNADGFVIDDRPQLEYSQWRAEPCMQNCKDEVRVTMRSVFLVEEPPEGGSNSVMNHNRDQELPSFTAEGPSFIPAATPKVKEEAMAQPNTDDATSLIASGEKVFRKCKACHQVGEGAKNATGPHLNGLMGRTFGAVDGFAYSNAFKSANAEGRIWDEAALAAFLAKPKDYIQGTKMAFAGLKKKGDQEAIAAFLASFLVE